MILTILTILAYWLAASFISALIFVWLLKTKRIGFEPVEDRNEFVTNWAERRP